MAGLGIDYILAFALFVLPGAITMYVCGLKIPQKSHKLQEQIAEAVCFSILNIVLMAWLLRYLVQPDFIAEYPFFTWMIILICFIVTPVIWAFALVWLLRFAEDKRLIRIRAKTAWDDFFSREIGCWIQVELKDGRIVGGRFDKKSYASTYPDPGHIYIEELWSIDGQGRFEKVRDGSPGIILRPTDYNHLMVFRGD